MNYFQKTHTVENCWIHTIQSHGVRSDTVTRRQRWKLTWRCNSVSKGLIVMATEEERKINVHDNIKHNVNIKEEAQKRNFTQVGLREEVEESRLHWLLQKSNTYSKYYYHHCNVKIWRTNQQTCRMCIWLSSAPRVRAQLCFGTVMWPAQWSELPHSCFFSL